MSSQPRPFARGRLAMIASVATIALAACATGSASSPGEAMDARLAQGTTIAVTIDADPADMADADAAAEVERMLAAQADGPLMTVAVDPDGAVAGMSLLDAVFVRRAGNDVYVRVDWDELESLDDEALQQDPRDALDQFGMAADGPGEMVAALSAGEWVGITGISDSAEQLMGALGPSEGAMLPDTSDEEVQALLEEQDLDSVDAFLGSYVTATGDNPWELTIDGAAVQRALDEVASAAAENGAGDLGMGTEDHELPATITGLTLTAEDGVATELRINMGEFMASMGEDAIDELLAGMGAGDLSDEQLDKLLAADPAIVLTMTDLGDNATPPADAVTMSLSELMSTMGG